MRDFLQAISKLFTKELKNSFFQAVGWSQVEQQLLVMNKFELTLRVGQRLIGQSLLNVL